MSGPFKVGDVVVRVAEPNIRGPNRPPEKGMPIRVEGVAFDSDGEQGLIFGRYPSNHPLRAWGHWSFRHLPRADETFTRQMNALRPVKEPAL